MPALRFLAFLALAIGLAGSRAAAQSAFIAVGIADDIHRFSSPMGPPVLDTEAVAVRVNGGAILAQRWVVGVEAEWGRDASVERITTVTLRGEQFNLTTTHTNRLSTVSALTGVDVTTSARFRLRVLGGIAFSRMKRVIQTDAPPIVLSSVTVPARTEYEDRFVAPVVGVDAAIGIGHGVAIVPALRAQALRLVDDLDGYGVRPSIGLSWTF